MHYSITPKINVFGSCRRLCALLLFTLSLFFVSLTTFAGFSIGYGFPGFQFGYGQHSHYRGGHFGYYQPFVAPRFYHRHAHPYHGFRSYSPRSYRHYRPRRFYRPHRFHRYRRY